MFFRGQYYFMSNMYPSNITVNGLTFSCVESAFQACKTLDPEIRKSFTVMDGFTAKRAGRRVPLRPDWEAVKVKVMKKLLEKKFADPQLADKLASVEGPIVEDNTWNDKFWGRCNGYGRNVLGQLLEQLRERIKETRA